MSESTIKAMLPTVTFRPSGAEHFHALLTLMVGTHVEITYVHKSSDWTNWKGGEIVYPLKSKRGEITYVTDEVIFLKPYGIPRNYRQGAHYRDVAIDMVNVKMIEVIG